MQRDIIHIFTALPHLSFPQILALDVASRIWGCDEKRFTSYLRTNHREIFLDRDDISEHEAEPMPCMVYLWTFGLQGLPDIILRACCHYLWYSLKDRMWQRRPRESFFVW
ncbi:hypothetical protein ONS95_002452 [Cadophora gregata]|uniref:uncharacterized protein n=1 Tax=Cadophora gregata TaxID=51156 RepID=UPI0026DBF978|nr:uncharacterized protein ONS95_002452 [Cadophora gregata]KAK0109776.1 hypothetical protein ONS95_002452 [Cadophora gregata]